MTDAETTRLLLVKMVLEASVNGGLDGRWSLQGLGMFRLYLSHEKRLHVWDARFRRDVVSTIHTHPWHFTSEIVSGRIEDRTYHEVQGASGFTLTHKRQEIVCGPGGGVTPEAAKPARLELVSSRVLVTGDRYDLLAHQPHETVIGENGTVTIITRRFTADTEHAHVYYSGPEWVSAEPRNATPAEVRGMAAGALRGITTRLSSART
jgi:hypothetical protein